MGEALCGGAPALRLHLQQRQRPGGARRTQPLHSTGGVQRRPAGHAQGRVLSHHVFSYIFTSSLHSLLSDKQVNIDNVNTRSASVSAARPLYAHSTWTV